MKNLSPFILYIAKKSKYNKEISEKTKIHENYHMKP